jgi:hypothetical protein
MKLVFSVVAVIILMIGAQSVYAETAYQSGFRHGVADVELGKLTEWNGSIYIHQSGKGFADHTTEFVNVYIHGFCLANGGGGSCDDADDAVSISITVSPYLRFNSAGVSSTTSLP